MGGSAIRLRASYDTCGTDVIWGMVVKTQTTVELTASLFKLVFLPPDNDMGHVGHVGMSTYSAQVVGTFNTQHMLIHIPITRQRSSFRNDRK